MLSVRAYVIATFFALAGCATQKPAPVAVVVPPAEPAKKIAEEVACCNCDASSYQAIAITQSPAHACDAACSDFPVGYRVQVPETNARVRNIDRTVVTSAEARVGRVAACNTCAGGACKSRDSK